MDSNIVYIVQVYYLFKEKIQSYPSSINKTLKQAYNNILEIYNIDPTNSIIFPSIPEKNKEEFLKYIFDKFKNKIVVTIIKC